MWLPLLCCYKWYHTQCLCTCLVHIEFFWDRDLQLEFLGNGSDSILSNWSLNWSCPNLHRHCFKSLLVLIITSYYQTKVFAIHKNVKWHLFVVLICIFMIITALETSYVKWPFYFLPLWIVCSYSLLIYIPLADLQENFFILVFKKSALSSITYKVIKFTNFKCTVQWVLTHVWSPRTIPTFTTQKPLITPDCTPMSLSCLTPPSTPSSWKSMSDLLSDNRVLHFLEFHFNLII